MFEKEMERMVDEQLISRGISDLRVLAAFRRVPRHEFVPRDLVDSAYGDFPLPIGEGQTISQPYMVALMTALLEVKPTDVVIEVGSGSGYLAAILSLLAKKVYAVERIGILSKRSGETLQRLGFPNVEVIHADGTLGQIKAAPFDRIIVSAQAEDVPGGLLDQLTIDGIMVIPIGEQGYQELTKITKLAYGLKREEAGGCTFVPLVRGKVASADL
jgi:protein-L-isoaspartate(D-aspartate) O-methyltransferase